MTFKDKLIWLQGKKIALCETDEVRFNEVKAFLQRYGIEVTGLRSAKEMLEDLETRRYSTHRVFFAVFVAADLARELEKPWQEIIKINPSILRTPLILTATPQQKVASQDLIEAGYFKFCLTNPVSPNDMLRVLRRLNRWNAMRGDTARAATLAK
jgi:DNA-binding response OmpR family regulator